MSSTIAKPRLFVKIRMIAANLAPTPFHLFFFFFPTSDVVHDCNGIGEFSFRLALIKSNSSLTWEAQNCSTTYSLVAFAAALVCAICGQALPVSSSNRMFFSSLSSALIRGPITDAGQQMPKHWLWSLSEDTSCGRHMPPSFARARQRPKGQNTSTAEETRHNYSLLLVGLSCPFLASIFIVRRNT